MKILRLTNFFTVFWFFCCFFLVFLPSLTKAQFGDIYEPPNECGGLFGKEKCIVKYVCEEVVLRVEKEFPADRKFDRRFARDICDTIVELIDLLNTLPDKVGVEERLEYIIERLEKLGRAVKVEKEKEDPLLRLLRSLGEEE